MSIDILIENMKTFAHDGYVSIDENGNVVDYDIFEALNMKKEIDLEMYKIAHEISI